MRKALSGRWIEWVAAALLGVTTIFSFLHEHYDVAVIASLCCGLVIGIQLGVWAVVRKSGR